MEDNSKQDEKCKKVRIIDIRLYLFTCNMSYHRYPPMAVLNRAFLEKHQWKLFKHLTVADALERQDGCLYANKAATSKGTSGASVFPGMRFCSPPEPNNVECILCRAGIELSEIEEKASRNHLPRLTK